MATRIDSRASALILLAACAWISSCGPTPSDEPVGIETPTGPTVVVDDPTPPPVTPPVEPAAPSVSVTFAVAADDGALQPATSASLLATPTMFVVADWKDLPADAAEQLALIAPSGSVYASTSFALVDGQGAAVETLSDGTVRATYRVEIWGTSIAQYRRTGIWTATVSLVDGTANASATIDLTP